MFSTCQEIRTAANSTISRMVSTLSEGDDGNLTVSAFMNRAQSFFTFQCEFLKSTGTLVKYSINDETWATK
jgi:hypothetical protein